MNKRAMMTRMLVLVIVSMILAQLAWAGPPFTTETILKQSNIGIGRCMWLLKSSMTRTVGQASRLTSR